MRCEPGVTMAGTMYAMKPVFELDGVVEVPQCMYALPVIQRSDSAAPAQSAECPPGALQALETRQDAILARLERLKVEVAAYKRTLGLADSAAAAPAAAGPSKAAAAPPTGCARLASCWRGRGSASTPPATPTAPSPRPSRP